MAFSQNTPQQEAELKRQQLANQERELALKQQRAEWMRSQGLNEDGSAIRPEWNSLIDPETGQLKDVYQLKADNYDPNTSEGYAGIKKGATRTGPSDWAKMMYERSRLNQEDQQAAAGRQAMSGLNAANQGLAMRGGLSSAARTALANQSQQGLLGARQQAVRGGIADRLQIDTTDEEQRQGLLNTLLSTDVNVGQYNTTANNQAKQANNNNLLQEIAGKRAADLDVYSEQMKKWAAEKQAQATANSGGGGGKK